MWGFVPYHFGMFCSRCFSLFIHLFIFLLDKLQLKILKRYFRKENNSLLQYIRLYGKDLKEMKPMCQVYL